MKINSVQFNNIDNTYKIKKVELDKSKIDNKLDSIQISDLGKYLNKVNTEKINASEENINIDKVNDIKKRIENGTYSVDSKILAEKIIEKMEGENSWIHS